MIIIIIIIIIIDKSIFYDIAGQKNSTPDKEETTEKREPNEFQKGTKQLGANMKSALIRYVQTRSCWLQH